MSQLLRIIHRLLRRIFTPSGPFPLWHCHGQFIVSIRVNKLHEGHIGIQGLYQAGEPGATTFTIGVR